MNYKYVYYGAATLAVLLLGYFAYQAYMSSQDAKNKKKVLSQAEQLGASQIEYSDGDYSYVVNDKKSDAAKFDKFIREIGNTDIE